jgi:hypothetical protein
MNIWLVGDSAIRAAVEEFATDLDAELIDTSVESAIPEQVWCEQIHDDKIRVVGTRLPDLTAIVFLSVADYDSENTAHQVARRMPANRQMLYLTYLPTDHVKEGPTHEGAWVKVGVLNDLNSATVLAKLQELYA